MDEIAVEALDAVALQATVRGPATVQLADISGDDAANDSLLTNRIGTGIALLGRADQRADLAGQQRRGVVAQPIDFVDSLDGVAIGRQLITAALQRVAIVALLEVAVLHLDTVLRLGVDILGVDLDAGSLVAVLDDNPLNLVAGRVGVSVEVLLGVGPVKDE